MTWVKKLNPDWYPQEHPGIIVGDVVDFPGDVTQLVREGNVALCDKDGNEVSAYETFGVITDREKKEFEAFIELKKQERLKVSLEKEHEALLAQAAEIKAEHATPEAPVPTGTVEEAQTELDDKKKAWAKKMADARAAKKAEKEAK